MPEQSRPQPSQSRPPRRVLLLAALGLPLLLPSLAHARGGRDPADRKPRKPKPLKKDK